MNTALEDNAASVADSGAVKVSRLRTAPALNRRSMVPLSVAAEAAAARAMNESAQPLWRRWVLLALIVGQTWFATGVMRDVLPYHGDQGIEVAILVLFALLFLWLSAGFWTATMGFVQLIFRRDAVAKTATSSGLQPAAAGPIATGTRTAIVMPICNEDVNAVFAGLQATYRSLAATGELEQFDFYILSDSSSADCRVAEIAAWQKMCAEWNASGRIHYRWRRHHIKRKSGNIADFCRRWGANYEHMVILDADSVMSGACLTRLVKLMEANPTAGIIQTAPQTVGRDSLYARAQQFASRVYGPVFVAGLRFWQQGESHYWGHNAIIRIAPFMQHCAVGRVPGTGALSGDILSHDFVEAALMRRAGWGVWIADDLPGSYEESPPTFVDDVKRDRRWCYGNLINVRLFFTPGFHSVHRIMFLSGAFSYVSALLWFVFLLMSSVMLAKHTLVEPQYFIDSYQLFPIWPEWNPEQALQLFSATAVLLFAPKFMSVAVAIARGPRSFGGAAALTASMLVETLLSAMLAPVRMIFHTRFVCAALLGQPIGWNSPLREDAETGWREATRWHGMQTLIGIGWTALIYWLNPGFLLWLLPIVGALMLSIPISVLSSRLSTGRLLRRAGLLLIPEELHAPRELSWKHTLVSASAKTPGLLDAVRDPQLNALICAQGNGRAHFNQQPAARHELVQRAGDAGPTALTFADKAALLDDPLALAALHGLVHSAASVHADWRVDAGSELNVARNESSGKIVVPARPKLSTQAWAGLNQSTSALVVAARTAGAVPAKLVTAPGSSGS